MDMRYRYMYTSKKYTHNYQNMTDLMQEDFNYSTNLREVKIDASFSKEL